MVALARILFMGFIALTVIYTCLWFYARARRRETLETTWKTTDSTQTCDSFVADGLQSFAGPLRRWLVVGVYVIPSVAIALLIYFTNTA
ncbi:hypothetical protein [Roseobacter sp.]|uniref:hypothetical protein n=1 Tax=Roseobacter sp. TaxID=1907202 RepID=UPI0032992F97